jgi:pimeloyl-ACP methyl ester carboxylesterase
MVAAARPAPSAPSAPSTPSTPSTPSVYREVALPQGTVRYRDEGTGPALVFIHGILANSTLWRDVIPLMRGSFRCIAPDLPLGGHPYPMRPDADQTPRGVSRLLADFLEALDLRDVTLVGNDTGGAICQVTIARHPARIARLVLTNCDAYEAFFPWSISVFHHGARLFGARFVDALAWVLRARAVQHTFLWAVAARRMDAATLDAYFGPFLRAAGVRRDLTRFLATVSNRYTLDAARAFPDFQRPVLIVWGRNDMFFPARYAVRLQRDFPDATLTFVSPSRAFVPEDQPDALARHISAFMGATADA